MNTHPTHPDQAPAVPPCTCIDYCSDDVSLIDCDYCRTLGVYEPCPVIGFGCGTGCDCCTPQQQRAADR